jgi:hypothetical protein
MQAEMRTREEVASPAGMLQEINVMMVLCMVACGVNHSMQI